MHRPHRLVAPSLAAALALVLAACGTEQATPSLGGGASAPASGAPSASAGGPSGSGGSGGGEGVESPIENIEFGPDLNVPVGTTVTWTNADGAAHTVTHGGGGQPADNPFFDQSVQPGETFEFTFETVGTVPITCRIHPNMEMQVITQ